MDFFYNLFDSDFMPHGHCYQWRGDILWLHVGSDALITLAYASIPLILGWFVKKRSDLAFKGVFILFAAFILMCGATHALEIWSVWHGTYRLTGIVKAGTAVVSLSTTGALLFLLPKALRLPSPRDLELANKKLLEETRDRMKAENELATREKEALFKAMVEASPNGILLVSKKGIISLANSAAQKLFCYGPGEMENLALDELIPESKRREHTSLVQAFFENPVDRIMAGGRELYAMTREGSQFPVEISLSPLDWKGETYVLASTVDISERQQQKDLLEKAHQRFDRAVAGAMDGLWEWRLTTDDIWYSDQFFRILGYEPEKEKATFDFWADRIHPDDKERVMETLDNHLKHDTPYNTEYRLLCGDGKYRWCLSRGNTFGDGKESKAYFSGSLSIIQSRKDAEQDLSEKNAFLDTIYKGTRHGIFVLDVTQDKDFLFAAFNPATEALTGIPFEKAKGNTVEALVPEFFPMEIAKEIRGNYERCLETGKTVHYTEMVPFKGRETWWNTSLTPLFDKEKRVCRIIGSSSEITTLKQMEKESREKGEYARKILDFSLNGLYIFDLKAQTNTYINPAYTRITGYTKEELENASNLLDLFHPEDVDNVIAHMTAVASSAPGQSQRIEYRFRHKQGHWIWCLSNDAVFTYEEGVAIEMIGTFIDITQIKDYGQKLEQSNQELEQFAFIASHDLREPLRKIKSFADLLMSRYKMELPEKGRDYLDRMAGAAQRLDLMINDLLSFSRVSQNQASEIVNLNQVVTTVLGDLKPNIIETGAKIHSATLPTLEGDSNHLYQLFLNLIGNAIKYTRPNVPPEVEISYIMDGKKAIISIQDNGIGIPADKTEEIFHIFKRLHGRSEFSGSGIGLAICKKIAERHGGGIWTEPLPNGTGSRFMVSLPIRK